MGDRIQMLRDEYRIRFAKMTTYRNAVWKILCDYYFSRFIPTDAQVLDLGSGWGEFINHIQAAQKYAMDLNPDSAKYLNAGIQFLQQDCSQPWELPAQTVDIVFTSNFIEHLSDKGQVERAIAEAYRCLKPNGRLIAMGPNIKYAPGAYWDFWDHFIPITELSLCELLKMQRFDIQMSIGRFVPYSMSTGIAPPLFMLKWYLNLPLLWPLFGKQFLVVGRKSRPSAS